MSAKDDMPRQPSDDPDVHRELVVVDPPMQGRDVANLQRAIRARLVARGLTDDVAVPDHGKFTHATWVAAVEAGYFIGLLSETYLRTDHCRGVSTEGAQTIIRNPDRRSDEQLKRAKARQGQLDRGPRYYRDLVGGGGSAKGAKAALEFAAKQIGITERPPGSNWGGRITDWIRAAGYNSPVPWCGCAVNRFCMAGGVDSGAGWIGYTPAIIAHAKAGRGGWRWHSSPQPGDLILFDMPGGDPAVHVGMVERAYGPTHCGTVEGNTSSGPGGSQDNGGGVFRRDRRSSPGFRIVGFARPPW
jgi:hypothetical protein